MLKYLSLFNWN